MGWWSGEAPSTELSGYTPWLRSPSYNFSSALYDYMIGMIGQPAPRPPGMGGGGRGMGGANVGPRIAPGMQRMMDLGRRFMDTGMPTVFGTGVSSLGRFLAPQFHNPFMRMQQGYPNYFGGLTGGQTGPPVPPVPLNDMRGRMDPSSWYQPPAPRPQAPSPQGPPGQVPMGAPSGFRYDQNQPPQPGVAY